MFSSLRVFSVSKSIMVVIYVFCDLLQHNTLLSILPYYNQYFQVVDTIIPGVHRLYWPMDNHFVPHTLSVSYPELGLCPSQQKYP